MRAGIVVLLLACGCVPEGTPPLPVATVVPPPPAAAAAASPSPSPSGGIARAASPGSACGQADDKQTHCVWLVLSGAARARAKDVAQALSDAGYPSEADGARITGWWTVAEIEKFFGVKIQWTLTGASATDRVVCQAVLPPTLSVPVAWRKDIAGANVDDPACEL